MLFSKNDLSKIIIPLLIEHTLAITIGMFDSMMVSSAGEAAVSGVSLVDTLNLLLIYLFSALAGGGAVVISQLIGSRNTKAACEASKQLIWVVTTLSLIIMTLSICFRSSLLKLIFGKIEADVMASAKIYFLFTAMSYPFLGVYNACASIFRSMGNSKISMNTSVIMNLINIGGNALLIFVFSMGAAGAAIATLFSRIVGATIMLVLVHNIKYEVHVEKLLRFKPNFILLKRICAIGIPNGLESGMFQFGKVLTQSLISGFGTIQIAANAVSNSLTALQYIPNNAIGLAMVTVVGRCIGAGEKEQAKSYTKKLLKMSYVCIFAISLVLCLLLKPIVGLYNLSEESSTIAINIIFIHSIVVSILHPVSFTITNTFRAASDVKFTMIISLSSMWVFRVGCSFLLAYQFNLGIYSVWVSMFIDWLFRASVFIIHYLKGKWLTKYQPLK